MKAAIFDMDGVLVDSHPVHLRAWERLLASKCRTCRSDQMAFILEGRKREDILRHLFGNLTSEEMRDLGQQKELFFRQESKGIEAIAGVREFLEQLDAALLPLAVASCGSAFRVNTLLDSLGLRKYFRFVITGDDVKEGKPDPCIFQIAAQRLGVSPFETVVFEDSISGVQAAKAAGMRCLGIGDGRTLQEAGADRVYADFVALSLKEVEEIFEETENEKQPFH